LAIIGIRCSEGTQKNVNLEDVFLLNKYKLFYRSLENLSYLYPNYIMLPSGFEPEPRP
jgi:hypothetical protein